MRRYQPVQPPILQGTGSDDQYSYREYLPSKSLANYVACYWTSQFHGHGQSTPLLHRVIPDGCVDIIFDLGARSFGRGAFVTGLMTAYELMPLVEPQAMFGIRFFVEEADRFFRFPVAEVSAAHVLLEDLWGSEALWAMEGMLDAADTAQRIAWAERLLMQSLNRDGMRQNALLLTSMQHLYEHQGNLSVAALAEKVCYSERNVRRMFQQALGIGPKELSRIIQFQSLLQLLAKGQAASFVDAAVQCGYYDQSHVIKSFRAYYGETTGGIFAVRGARAQPGEVVRFLQIFRTRKPATVR
ncbi:helix-turn-helix transcriptional regulator [Brevibacillus agri]|uniref:DUF6597 domain-containing transcriptional factor n=1 Tax=Brevibacillus agri TaxID=51101 RepID=UPI003D24CEF3